MRCNPCVALVTLHLEVRHVSLCRSNNVLCVRLLCALFCTQAKLGISDEELAKWRFNFCSQRGGVEYLQDTDCVGTRFARVQSQAATANGEQPFLGMEVSALMNCQFASASTRRIKSVSVVDCLCTLWQLFVDGVRARSSAVSHSQASQAALACMWRAAVDLARYAEKMSMTT